MRFITLMFIFYSCFASSQISNNSSKKKWDSNGSNSTELLDSIHRILDDWDASPDDINDLSIEYWNLAKESNNQYHIAWSNMHRGLVLMKLANYEKAKMHLDQSLEWAYANKDVKLTVDNHSMLVNIAYVRGDYETVANLQLKSWDLIKDSDNRELKSSVLTNLGVVYSTIGKYNEAKKYTLMGLYLKDSDLRGKVICYQNLSVIYSNLELYDSAYIYCDSALQLSSKDSRKESLHFFNNMSTTHNRMSQILVQLGKREESMKHCHLALEYSRKSKNKYEEAKALVTMSKVNSGDSTLLLLTEALNIAKEIKSVKMISTTSHELYNYYKGENLMDEALEMLELYNLTKDSIKSEEALEKIITHGLKDDYEEKEDQQRKIHQKEIKAGENRLNKLIYIGSFSGLFLLAFFVFMWRRQLTYKKERTKLLNEINELKSQALNKQNLEDVLDKKQEKLNREILDAHIKTRINDSDWSIIQNLYSNPSISNKELAENVALSIEGAKSSLKKMYRLFEIPSSRNMKLALIIKIISISRKE